MDDPSLREVSHFRALDGLARLNRLSLTARTLWAVLSRATGDCPERPCRVLDLACGGGDITRRLDEISRREGRHFHFDGCDMSPRAVEHASRRADRSGASCGFYSLNLLEEPLPEDYDYFVSSLFVHHLSETEVLELLHRAAQAVRRGFLITDLDRSLGGLLLAQVIPRLVTRSPVVHGDAVLSARAALTMEEIESLVRRTGLDHFTVARCWPSRWILCWQKEQFLDR